MLNIIIFLGVSGFAHMGTALKQNNTTLHDQEPAPKLISFALHRKNMSNASTSARRRLRQYRRRTDVKIFEDVNVMGSFEDLGYFYTFIHIGTPPQRFTVILDTGSVVTSVPCSGCLNCGTHMDPVFNYKKSSTAHNTHRTFSQSYTEGSSLRGEYISDVICIGDTCRPEEAVQFEFGCANRMTNLFRTQLADGIMGMASTGHTILNALRDHHQLQYDIYTLCLSHDGGFFSIGGYHTKRHRGAILWAKNASPGGKYYRIAVGEIKVNGVNVNASPIDLRAGSGGALVDSGTTFTYVPYNAFSKLKSAFAKYCNQKGKCVAKSNNYDATSVHCYNEFRDDETFNTFPNIQLKIGDRYLCFPPQQYFFQERHNTCVGFMKDASFVLGSNLMMDHDLIFDRANSKVGFARASCHAARSNPWCCDDQCSGEDGVIAEKKIRHLKTDISHPEQPAHMANLDQIVIV